MLKTFELGGIKFHQLPHPVEVTVKADSAKRLSNIPSHRVIHVLGKSVKKEEKLVAFAKPGDTKPIDRLYEGHIEEPPEEWMTREEWMSS